MPTQELRDGVDRLVQVYDNDLEETMADEIVHFAALCKIFPFSKPAESKQSKELQMFVMLKKQSLESVFPNVTIALRMYLSLMNTNCSGERSFSVLKRLKNTLRSTMCQSRLNSLSLLCIESEKLQNRMRDTSKSESEIL